MVETPTFYTRLCNHPTFRPIYLSIHLSIYLYFYLPFCHTRARKKIHFFYLLSSLSHSPSHHLCAATGWLVGRLVGWLFSWLIVQATRSEAPRLRDVVPSRNTPFHPASGASREASPSIPSRRNWSLQDPQEEGIGLKVDGLASTAPWPRRMK
jgi:hypothetical protein